MHIVTEKGATIMLDGRARLVPRSHPQWETILANLADPDALRRILEPTTVFVVGERWRTRSGGVAEILNVEGTKVTALIDDLFEVETVSGAAPDPEDSLTEKL